MFNFFINKTQLGMFTGVVTYPKFEVIKKRLLEDLEHVLDYYNNTRVRSIRNEHMLSRLIETILPNPELDIVEYYKLVDASSIYISKRFGIVSNINKGFFTNFVLQSGGYELFIYSRNDIDIFTYNYKDLYPIKCICSKDTRLSYDLPYYNGIEDSEELWVYEIDVVMLMLQYYSWYHDKKRNNESTDINRFVSMVVIPSVIRTEFNLNIWNRFKAIYRGEHVSDFKNNHPFYITNHVSNIDNILKDIIKKQSNNPVDIEKIFYILPCIDNMLDSIKLNNKLYTTQSYYTLYLSRVDDVLFLMDFLGDRGRAKNKDWISYLRYDLQAIKNGLSRLPITTPNKIKDKYNKNMEYLFSLIK